MGLYFFSSRFGSLSSFPLSSLPSCLPTGPGFVSVTTSCPVTPGPVLTVVPKNCRRHRAVCAASPPPLCPPPSPLMAGVAEVRLARAEPTLLAGVAQVLDPVVAVVVGVAMVGGAADVAAGADNA